MDGVAAIIANLEYSSPGEFALDAEVPRLRVRLGDVRIQSIDVVSKIRQSWNVAFASGLVGEYAAGLKAYGGNDWPSEREPGANDPVVPVLFEYKLKFW
jgi:hypothetical protein